MALLISITGFVSTKINNPKNNWMPCFALIQYDSLGNPVVKNLKPAHVTEKEWIECIHILVEKELAKKNLTPKLLGQIIKTQRTTKTIPSTPSISPNQPEYSPLRDITYDFATGFWRIGRGLFYLSYEISKGLVFVSIQAGKNVVVPLSKASLYYVLQTIKSLAHYSITSVPQQEEQDDIMPPLEPQTEYPLPLIPAIEATPVTPPPLLAIEYPQN